MAEGLPGRAITLRASLRGRSGTLHEALLGVMAGDEILVMSQLSTGLGSWNPKFF